MAPLARFLAVLVCALSLHGACVETVLPRVHRELPAAKGFAFATDLAWLPNGRLLIGARDGVFDYSLADGAARRIVSGASVPAGLPMVDRIETDGATIVASSLDYSDIVFDLAKRKVVRGRRAPEMLIFDTAVRGKTQVVLAVPVLLRGVDIGSVWVGEAGQPWKTFRLLHAADARLTEAVRRTPPPYGGGMVLSADRTIAMITPVEPGVLRYRLDGAPLPSLGTELRELVIPALTEMVSRYNVDLAGRYREVLNKQPLADDLIETADGLAIVVRRWAADRVWWELWFPDAHGTRRRVRLGVEDVRAAGGHMRCDARGAQVACIYGRFVAADKPNRPHVAVFDLTRTKRGPECR
jgi:hypothetical protein